MHTNNRNDDEIHHNAEGCEWVCGPHNTWLPKYAQTNNLPYPSRRSNFSPVPPHAQLDIQPYQQATQTLGVGPSIINPASVLLPADDEDDFPPPSKILSEIARPATKVGGAHHSVSKGKGKAKATPDVDDDDTTSQKRKRGSQKGRVEDEWDSSEVMNNTAVTPLVPGDREYREEELSSSQVGAAVSPVTRSEPENV
ncbi:protein [Lentinula edodes]|uniref:Protein n=1 Tax=Lentinula edodes TaxID=5353 RepID=A0A1Q3EJL1_LENED|nr:protein [Lentinula edodes]